MRWLLITGISVLAIPSIYGYWITFVSGIWRHYPFAPSLNTLSSCFKQLMFPIFAYVKLRPDINFDKMFFRDGYIWLWPCAIVLLFLLIWFRSESVLAHRLFRRSYILHTLLAVALFFGLWFSLVPSAISLMVGYFYYFLFWFISFFFGTLYFGYKASLKFSRILRVGFEVSCRFFVYQFFVWIIFFLILFSVNYIVTVPALVFAENTKEETVVTLIQESGLVVRHLVNIVVNFEGPVLISIEYFMWFVLMFFAVPRLAFETTIESVVGSKT